STLRYRGSTRFPNSASKEHRSFGLTDAGGCSTTGRQRIESGVGFAARNGEVEQVADADGERNQAEGRGGPGFRLVHDAGDHSKGRHVANRAANQKNGVLAGTRGWRNRFLERNSDAASDSGHALIGL